MARPNRTVPRSPPSRLAAFFDDFPPFAIKIAPASSKPFAWLRFGGRKSGVSRKDVERFAHAGIVIDASYFPAKLVIPGVEDSARSFDALNAAITGPEIARADGRHLYMVFPDGMGNSKAAPLIEKLLGARGTARNWNTVTKLAALAGAARR